MFRNGFAATACTPKDTGIVWLVAGLVRFSEAIVAAVIEIAEMFIECHFASLR